MSLADGYPMLRPRVRMLTPTLHPAVLLNGAVRLTGICVCMARAAGCFLCSQCGSWLLGFVLFVSRICVSYASRCS